MGGNSYQVVCRAEQPVAGRCYHSLAPARARRRVIKAAAAAVPGSSAPAVGHYRPRPTPALTSTRTSPRLSLIISWDSMGEDTDEKNLIITPRTHH